MLHLIFSTKFNSNKLFYKLPVHICDKYFKMRISQIHSIIQTETQLKILIIYLQSK